MWLSLPALSARLAPGTAGRGASPEWRSVEAAPKPQGLSARPLLGESGVPREPVTSPLKPGVLAHARTHRRTLFCDPTITGFRARTLALTARMHGLPRARGFAHTPAQLPASRCLRPVASKWWVCTSIFCARGRSGWTRCPWPLDKPGTVCVLYDDSSPCLCLPHAHLSIVCLFYAFCFHLNLLYFCPCLFLLLGLATYSESPTPPLRPSICPFRSRVRNPSARSRTGV